MRQRIALALAAALGGALFLMLVLLQATSPASATDNPTSIATGYLHSCAVKFDSTVHCWGLNSDGQLGDGTLSERHIPVPVCLPTSLAGAPSCCPIVLSGSPAGIGPSDCSLAGIQQVVAGFVHTCALTNAGSVKCWGDNGVGQLGDGSFSDRSYPVDVCEPGGVSGVVGPSPTCCPILLGAPQQSALEPRIPSPPCGALADVTAISAGAGHTCALQEPGTVWCWGSNNYGQLGDGTTDDSSTPLEVCASGPIVLSATAGFACTHLTGVIAIAAGGQHTCALMSDSGVKCWGSDSDGQLGYAGGGDSLYPQDVCDSGSAIAGVTPSCCLVAGTAAPSGERIPVASCHLTGVTSISAGGQHTCAVLNDTSAVCWGDNVAGQLGDGSNFDRDRPVSVCQPIVFAGTAGSTSCCLIVSGSSPAGILPPCPTLNGIDSISAGFGHTCAVMVDGGLLCWGINTVGKLGNGTTFQSDYPTPVCEAEPLILAGVLPSCTPLSGATAVSSGYGHTCALTEDKRILCWGDNTAGELGDGTTSEHDAPGVVFGFAGKFTPTATNTPPPGATNTPTPPAGATNTPTAPAGATSTPTAPAGATNTPTRTNTPLAGATSTPTRTPTAPVGATSTPIRTNTPPAAGLLGDVNCDGHVNSIDAALILQLVAGLTHSVPCPQNADVNNDGTINPIDSALIFQYTAGLIHSL